MRVHSGGYAIIEISCEKQINMSTSIGIYSSRKYEYLRNPSYSDRATRKASQKVWSYVFFAEKILMFLKSAVNT